VGWSVSVCGAGFAHHVPGNAPLATDVTANAVDTVLPLAVTAIAPVDGIGGGRYPLVIKTGQGLVKGRRQDCCHGVAPPRAPLDPRTQRLELRAGALGAAAAVQPGLEVLQEVPAWAPLRAARRARPPLLARAGLERTCDKEAASRQPATELVLTGLAGAGPAARHRLLGRRSTACPLRLGRGETVALSRDGTPEALGPCLQDREGTQGMGHRTQDGAERLGRERRASGGEALEEHVAMGPGRRQALANGAMRSSILLPISARIRLEFL
jgi:hypothetical protein